LHPIQQKEIEGVLRRCGERWQANRTDRRCFLNDHADVYRTVQAEDACAPSMGTPREVENKKAITGFAWIESQFSPNPE
jgi:hypothetical protein